MSTAVIAGGGIGGLSVALALARVGWRVIVCEQAPELREVGAGIQISPNAAKCLKSWGLLDAVTAQASTPREAVMRDGKSGVVIYRAGLGEAGEARWGAPYLHIHRADLLRILAEAARSYQVEIRTGARAERYWNDTGRARLVLADGSRIDADVIVGADGIRSALRGQLNGADEPRFTDQVAWRGTVPASVLPPGLVDPCTTVWAGSGRHLVTYFLRGGQLVNFVAVEERETWEAEGWSRKGEPAELVTAFADWHPQVTGLLAHVEECYLWGLFDRPEQVRWVEGRVALLGDAAHPMLPFMAQGAAMAMEDAALLSRLMPPGADIPAALEAWEDRRWHRVTRVQARARANGRLFHARPGISRTLRWGPVATVSRVAPALAEAQLDWLYGHDVAKEL
ncbi:MAG: FAD-dependent monooxygenase [Pseudomonadota bacterium]